MFLIVHAKRIFHSSHLCSRRVFGALVTAGFLRSFLRAPSSTSASNLNFLFFFTPTNSPYVAIAANYSREIGRRRGITAGEELWLRAKPTASGQAQPLSLRRCPRRSGRRSFMLLGLHYRSGKEQLVATPPPSNSL